MCNQKKSRNHNKCFDADFGCRQKPSQKTTVIESTRKFMFLNPDCNTKKGLSLIFDAPAMNG